LDLQYIGPREIQPEVHATSIRHCDDDVNQWKSLKFNLSSSHKNLNWSSPQVVYV